MAITTTVNQRKVWGNNKVVFGYVTLSAGGTTGAVLTGLSYVESMTFTSKTTGTVPTSPVTYVLPASGGNVTIVSDADCSYYFEAKGK